MQVCPTSAASLIPTVNTGYDNPICIGLWHAHKPELGWRLLVTLLAVIFYYYPSLLTATLSLFTCYPIDPSSPGQAIAYPHHLHKQLFPVLTFHCPSTSFHFIFGSFLPKYLINYISPTACSIYSRCKHMGPYRDNAVSGLLMFHCTQVWIASQQSMNLGRACCSMFVCSNSCSP